MTDKPGRLAPEWLKKAKNIVGDDGVLDREEDVRAYAHDESAMDAYAELPLAVVKPSTEQHVSDLVRLCAETCVPVTARGGGTGLSAACVPSTEGIVLSLERMDRMIEASASDAAITVQAGMTLARFYEEVDGMGLFFPPHPGDESAMMGGLIATNAGGARAVKYGTVRNFVRGLQVVLAGGEIVNLGGSYMKSSAGYSLLSLLIGSEGTLGIITRVTLALLPHPGSIQTLIAPFATVHEAIETVPAILESGIVPFAVEFVEHASIRCAERLLNRHWPAHEGNASLLIMLDGASETAVMDLAERVAEVLEGKGARDVLLAEHSDQQREILEIRSMIYESLRPGSLELLDVCVPRSQIAPHVEFVHSLEEKMNIQLPTYGHAADGNVHTHLMRVHIEEDGSLGAEVPGWREHCEKARKEIFDDAVRRGGVISGEHGVGLMKREHLESNIGQTAVAMMRSVKKALDPQGILNPGKIFSLS